MAGLWNRRWYLVTAVFGILLAGVGFHFRAKFRLLWKRYILRRSSAVVVQEFFRELSEILEKVGFSRIRGETALEYCTRAGLALESDIPVAVAEIYYQVRFGGYRPDRSCLDRLNRYLQQLSASIRQKH